MKYRKKPVVIEAIRYDKSHIGKALDFCNELKYNPHDNEYYVQTLEGAMKVSDGDYIIKGVKGEFYPCREDIFLQTYEEVEGRVKNMTNFRTQEEFTDKLNELILEGKKQGFSTKDIYDKWHTFGDLYYHRMILTYIILKNYPNLSWKSKQHHDGTMFDDSFIVGIETPKGQYSYHYNLKYWELFDIKELDKAPIYDGHKPEDIDRLLSLL